MAIRKSRNYTQDDGSKVSFDFDGGKLVGMKKDGTSLNPESIEFVNLSNTDDALRAYRQARTNNMRMHEKVNQMENDISEIKSLLNELVKGKK